MPTELQLRLPINNPTDPALTTLTTYSTAQAAKVLGVSQATIRNWIQEGYLEAIRSNPQNPKSNWRILHHSLVKMLPKNKEVPHVSLA